MWWLIQMAAAEEPSTMAPPAEAPPTEAPDPRSLVAPLGFDKLDQIAELQFTFNVERDGVLKGSRSWRWRPAEGTVTRVQGDESVTFVFGAPKDETEKKADAQFVNDSFWLAPQMHMAWAGKDLQVIDRGTAPDPMGPEGATAREVTLLYASDGGGYTPGDAYDLFLDGEGRIVAWHYREGNAEAPSATTRFGGYVPVGPLQVATEHTDAAGSFRLFFTDLQATPR